MSIPANLPISAGVGFKPEHLGEILAAPQPIGFFEIHAENYIGGRRAAARTASRAARALRTVGAWRRAVDRLDAAPGPRPSDARQEAVRPLWAGELLGASGLVLA